ncbi:MAG TPA: pitrilysin family protein [Bryobacteraceae bacterium]|nr:pitrilysin family protein [Bryobacteraceae bacterium]
MRTILGALLLASLLGAQQDTRTSTLANGMKVIVQEDHGIPNVAMYFFYRIGSRNERPGATGLSHFFEHMMFNGAKKYGPKMFDKMMDNNGGNNNAYTSNDVTVYTDWFPSSALELMFDMESDRIRDLAFDPKIIESERGVVYSERRSSVDNSNMGMLRELAMATAFEAHPYHWPVVGWPSDIESWTMDDLKNHFRMGYAPNNCVMVMVGDVRFDQVMGLARKYLEPIPRQEPPPPVRTKEPAQLGERRVTLSKPAQLPLQMVLFHVPETKNPDTPALQLAGTVLTQGQSSRLYQRMVDREQLALSVGGGVPQALDPTLFQFIIQPRSGVDPAATEKALYEELARLGSEPVPEAELRKAKNQMLAAFYRSLKTIEGRANLLGTYEVFHGDYAALYDTDKRIEAVTAADVERVARQYFTAKNRTVATLVPEKAEVGQ